MLLVALVAVVAESTGEPMRNRKILFISKFPPWQGGTATHALTAALAFNKEGYETHVLTLDPGHNSGLCHHLDDTESQWLEGISVTRLTMNEHRVATLVGDAAFSLLLGEAIAIIKSNRIDVVVGWYFDPFCVAAATISKYFQIPCFLRHAGSDLDRLTESPATCNAYHILFRECEAIFTNTNNKKIMDRISRLNMPMESVINLGGAKLPDYYSNSKLKEKRDNNIKSSIQFLIYGKISPFKGAEELAKVIKSLIDMGLPSRLVNLAAGSSKLFQEQRDKISIILDKKNSFDILPPVAPWKVPEIMRECDFICILENKFPIDIHSGIILREALSSGKVVIISRDVVDKSAFHDSLCDGINCIIIDDVQDIDSFSKKVYLIARDERRRNSISYLGLKLSNFIENNFPSRHPMITEIENRLDWRHDN